MMAGVWPGGTMAVPIDLPRPLTGAEALLEGVHGRHAPSWCKGGKFILTRALLLVESFLEGYQQFT